MPQKRDNRKIERYRGIKKRRQEATKETINKIESKESRIRVPGESSEKREK